MKLLTTLFLGTLAYSLIGQTTLVRGLSSVTHLKVDTVYKRSDSLEVNKIASKVYLSLIKGGYIGASLDSTTRSAEGVELWFWTGSKIEFTKLNFDSTCQSIMGAIGVNRGAFANRQLRPMEVKKLMSSAVGHLENNGYPFARMWLDSIQMHHDSLSAVCKLDKGELLQVDTIYIKGGAKLSPTYIYNYIGLKPHDVYSEKLIRQVDTRLLEIPFLTQIKGSEVEFFQGKSRLHIYAKDKKANSMNGILGVQPDENGKITYTGDVRIILSSALKRGEVIDLNWRALQGGTQDLQFKVNYPYLFNSSIGVNGKFKLYKRDTTFIELNPEAGILYQHKQGNYVKGFLNYKSLRLLNTSKLANATTLPQNSNIDLTLYGLGVHREKLDFRLNPRRGYTIDLSAGAGQKIIKKINEIPSEVYDQLESLTTIQYKIEFTGSIYIPIPKRSTIFTKFSGAHLQDPNLYQNELFRIGGLHTLRGFDEESLRAQTYGIGTIEYRFLLDQYSNLFGFFDYCYYQKQVKEQGWLRDRPLSFGAGIRFRTKPGVFAIHYALGRQQNNRILVKTGKVHFGFVSYF